MANTRTNHGRVTDGFLGRRLLAGGLLLAVVVGCAPAWRQRVLTGGVRARAVVLTTEFTPQGWSSCDGEATLLVTPEDGSPFEAVVHVCVDKRGPVHEGEQLVVRFDPEDRSRVVVESTPEREGLRERRAELQRRRDALERTVSEVMRADALARELNASSGAARTSGRVLRFEEIHPLPAHRAVHAVARVEVEAPEGGSFTADVAGNFARSGLHKYQPGREVFVVYDPNDRTSRITFDSERMDALP